MNSPSTTLRTLSAALLGLSLFGVHSTASAYCRTTTCPANEPGGCGRTAAGCAIKGAPLYWPDMCVTFGVHYEGSKLRAIPYERAETAARAAFQEWISADCGSRRTPSIGVSPRGEVYCDKLEFNHDGPLSPNPPSPNANIIVFRDTEWPYNDESRTIALTTITFAKLSGEILDADIEVNSANIELSTSETAVTSDLQAILTHEVGHFLGLAHSLAPNATMNEGYDRSDLGFRTLSNDDIRGICSIYPGTSEPITDCTGEEPRYGFGRYCGSPDLADAGVLCSTYAGRKTSVAFGWLGLAALMLVASRRRLFAEPRV